MNAGTPQVLGLGADDLTGAGDSAAGQVAGALRAWDRPGRPARVVICPAFPAQSRTVVGGHVLVHGLPLEQSPAASDPVTPVSTATLTTLVTRLRSGSATHPRPVPSPATARLLPKDTS